jgi:hypothetical protein
VSSLYDIFKGVEQMAKRQDKKQEGNELTSIRATRDTTSYINDVIKVLSVALGREITQEEVVITAVKAHYGKMLEESRDKIQDSLKRNVKGD